MSVNGWTWRSALVFVLFCSAAPAFSQAPPRDAAPRSAENNGTGVIRGRVITEGTGEPLPRFTVYAYQVRTSDSSFAYPGMPSTLSAISSDTGEFEIRGVPEGRYLLAAQVPRERPQFLFTTYGSRRPFDRGTTIDVAEGAVVRDIELRIGRAGVISGRVVNELGEPVAYVSVSALLRRAGTESGSAGPPRETDDLGRFRLFGLAPGEYIIKAEPGDYGTANPFDKTTERRYVPAFYPSALAPEEAQPLTVEAGQEVADVEIGLRRTRTYRVSGAVLSARGDRFSRSVGVSYSRTGSHSWGGNSTLPDGTFAVSALAPGEYTFVASSEEFGRADGDPEVSPPITIQVNQDVTDLVLQTKRGSRVNGRVTIEEGAKVPDAGLEIQLIQPEPTGMILFSATRSATVRPDGTFTLPRVFGKVLFRLNALPAHMLKSVSYKGDDITDIPMELPDVADARDLTMTVSNRGAAITGTVTDQKGLPVSDAVILLFAADQKRWAHWAQTTRQTGLDRSGRFGIKPLRPEKYLIVALEPDDRTVVDLRDARKFERLASIATPVELTQDETREIVLTLAKPPADR